MDDEITPEERDLVEEARAEAKAEGPGVVRRAGHALSQAALLSLSAIFAVFALANRQPVSFSWLVGENLATTTATGEPVSGGVPLILLLVVAFVLGFAIGWIVHWRRVRRNRRAG